MKKLATLFCFLWSFSAYAIINFSVSIVYELGTGENMVLRSELHSIEQAFEGKKILLKMQEGVSFSFFPKFIKLEETQGPSAHIKLNGEVFDYQNRLIQALEPDNDIVKIGESKEVLNLLGEGRRVEIQVQVDIE